MFLCSGSIGINSYWVSDVLVVLELVDTGIQRALLEGPMFQCCGSIGIDRYWVSSVIVALELVDIGVQRASLEESHGLVSINKEPNRYRKNKRSKDAIRKKDIFPKQEAARVRKEQLKQPQLNRVGDIQVTQGKIFDPFAQCGFSTT